MSIDLSGPFRGSDAVAAGLVTKGALRRPRFRRLYPDVYVPAGLEPDLALRSRAAFLLVASRGAVAGYAAAELLGASCGRADAPVEVILSSGFQRHRSRGLVVHRGVLVPDDTTTVCGVVVTTPVRTAFDLARWTPNLTEKVVAVDALAHRHRFGLGEVMAVKHRHLGAHGSRDLPRVLRLADPRSESPMESRIRMALVLGGLPTPVVQHPVDAGAQSFRLDLAYPAVRIGIEYDGEPHRRQQQAHRDLAREALLVALGWKILRFDAWTVLHRPDVVMAEAYDELNRRGFAW